MHEKEKTELAKIGFLDLYVGFAALYSVVLLAIVMFADITEESRRICSWVDMALCLLFVFDLALRWKKHDCKVGFWKWGWIDLLACVPAWPFLRWLRALRIVRIMRMIPCAEGKGGLSIHIFRGRRVSAPFFAFLMFFTIMIIGAPAVLIAESCEPDATIKTAGNAIWWIFETISTVGYGDLYPITFPGRVVGVMTMLFGVGMFGALTATVFSLFRINQNDSDGKTAEIKALREENSRLETLCAKASKASSQAKTAGNDCNLA